MLGLSSMAWGVCSGDEEAGSSGEEDTGGEEEGGGDGEEPGGRPGNRRAKPLPGEDRFMRLDDMETFLQDAERAAVAEDAGLPIRTCT